ncbi:glycoside hydrolase family 31 protein [Marinilabilia salmonicolor]|uniref:Alpha-glucosidase (Family GH31 glycosyl hydrolase) n=1 Tax=Marinilabilia salmonicolor TaxID=989 RepID=A0A368UUK6_9BACT|nr:TIM-barrel domain-containing protein [Marinilabilia salmonicolor]RCW32547.1 alpha-glucosidase (family GH31 glycosyl hydrolase) [Marinilabilia salmonicolor]
MKYFFPFLWIALIVIGCQSGISDAELSGNKVVLKAESLEMRLWWCTPEMVRISIADRSGHYDDLDSIMVVKHEWGAVDFDVSSEGDEWIISSAVIDLHVDKKNLATIIYDKHGKIIFGTSSSSSSASESVIGYKDDVPFLRARLFPGEEFFGFGERMDFLSQRGKKLTLDVGRGLGRPHEIGAYNILKANYCPVPFFMSSRGYGYFFHNAWPSHWNMGSSSDKEWSVKADGGAMDCYFMYGPEFTKLIENYTSITGRSPLLPRFAMGLHVGTYSGGTWGHEDKTSQDYVVDLARKFREQDVPADLLWLDSTWRLFGKVNGKGGTTFEWRQPGFPDPKSMFDKVYEQNFNMAGVHIRPRLDNTDENNLLEQAQELGVTYSEGDYPGDFPNFFDEVAEEWWWQNGLKPLAELGVMFVKTDEGSAFGRQGNELLNKTGPQGEKIPELHNLFPVVYTKAPYEKLSAFNKMRGLTQTREGFAGVQRYPYIFAGDWPSEWQYFAPVLRAGINIGLSGVGAWTHCMGGFEHVADPELYVRWCQFGMFSPVAMLFGMEHPQYKEPWNYGEEALKIFRKFDNLRYSLVPYIYSSYFQMYQSGVPIMRAMVMHWPEDKNTYSIDDQYMFGDNIMVCPVLTKGTSTRIVYFPKGEWYDFWSGEKIEGGQYKLVVTPIEEMPLYVKAGGILPRQPEMEYMGEKAVDPLTLQIFTGETGSFTLYEDDGRSLDYQYGKFSATEISMQDSENNLSITVGESRGDYDVEDYGLVLEVLLDEKPSGVSMADGSTASEIELSAFDKNKGDQLQWAYDDDAGKLFVSGKRNVEKEAVFVIKY